MVRKKDHHQEEVRTWKWYLAWTTTVFLAHSIYAVGVGWLFDSPIDPLQAVTLSFGNAIIWGLVLWGRQR